MNYPYTLSLADSGQPGAAAHAGTPVMNAADPKAPGGYRPAFYPAGVNHCPCCARSHWHVGRRTAECAFCETVLPLATGRVRVDTKGD